MRRTLTKEVTHTTLKVSKLEMVEGKPEAVVLPDMFLLGAVSQEAAQKAAEKEYGKGAMVFELKSETQVYEMPVEEFIKVASIKVVAE